MGIVNYLKEMWGFDEESIRIRKEVKEYKQSGRLRKALEQEGCKPEIVEEIVREQSLKASC